MEDVLEMYVENCHLICPDRNDISFISLLLKSEYSHFTPPFSLHFKLALISGLQTQEGWANFTIQILQLYLVSGCQKAINIPSTISSSPFLYLLEFMYY